MESHLRVAFFVQTLEKATSWSVQAQSSHNPDKQCSGKSMPLQKGEGMMEGALPPLNQQFSWIADGNRCMDKCQHEIGAVAISSW